jgi:hypothetical protein
VNSTQSRSVLVKLMGVVSDFAEETEADSNGKFSLGTLEQGKYLLFAIDRGVVIGKIDVTVDVSKPRSIDVGVLK